MYVTVTFYRAFAIFTDLHAGMVPPSAWVALALVVLSVPAYPAFPQPSLEKVTSAPADDDDVGLSLNKSIQHQQHPMISPTFAQESGTGAQGDLCRRPARHCQHLPNVTCFGNPLTYSHISFDHTGLEKIYEVKSRLSQEWEWLRSVPQCWKAVQPLLCSVYLPRCDEAGQTVEMVSRHLCKAAQGPCRIIGNRTELPDWPGRPDWPEFLRCDNEDVFSQRWSCEEQKRTRPRFNSSFSRGNCTSPLVGTTKTSAFFHEFDDCGMQCLSPLFSEWDRRATGNMVVYTAGLGLAFALIGMLTHMISGCKDFNRYPGAIIFYMCACWALCFVAFLMQFTVASKEELVCSGDGTRYTGGASEGSQNPICNINFFMLYYAFISNCIWFVILSYCWHIKFAEQSRSSKRSEEVFSKKNAYFHMSAWLIPLILCITVIALDLVEGKDLIGVCFVSTSRPWAMIIAVLCPIAISLCVSVFYTYKPIVNLYKTYRRVTSKSAPGENSNYDSAVHQAFRIGGFLAFHYAFCIYVFSYLIYYMWSQDTYAKALYDYVVCRAKHSVDGEHSVHAECEVKERPNATFFLLLLLLSFFSSLAVVSWKMSAQSWATWKEFLNKIFRCGSGDGVKGGRDKPGKEWPKVARHRLVQQGYANRQGLAETGRLSMSLPSLSVAHNNPVDLYALRHLADSDDDFSTSFARALPRLVQRRNAICGSGDGMGLERPASSASAGLSRSHSMISYGSRQISLIDRRRSFDSQLSIQPSELDHLQNIYDRGRKKKKSKRNFFGRKLRRRYSAASRNSMTSNGGDSIASQFSRVLPAVTKEPPKMAESVGGSSILSSGLSEMGDFKLKTFNKFSSVGEQFKMAARGNHGGGAQSELPYEELERKLATLSQSIDTAKAVDTACASVQGWS